MPRSLRRADPQPSTLDLGASNELIHVALRRVPGAKRFTLRVRSATRDVVLTMPQRASVASAREFAEKHVAWIGARMRRLPQPVAFAPGSIIPLRGEPHVIAHRPDARGYVWVENNDTGDAPLLCIAGAPEHLARRLGDFLRREAHKDLKIAVGRHAATINVAVKGIGVRDTTSRWGSCSVSGSLSFSWRLIMAPSFVLDYLAAHEVAHRVHHDHSPRFWSLTASLSPETDRAEAWLKAHGVELHRYGANARR
jgi:predicted metal-dependent hydrolase